MGFLDCVQHIGIQNPNHSGSMFRNYKHLFSTVLQGVAGHDYNYIIIDTGNGGGVKNGDYGGVQRRWEKVHQHQCDFRCKSLGSPVAYDGNRD